MNFFALIGVLALIAASIYLAPRTCLVAAWLYLLTKLGIMSFAETATALHVTFLILWIVCLAFAIYFDAAHFSKNPFKKD